MSDKLGDATCTILAALVAILVFCSLALQHIVLTNRRYPTHTHRQTDICVCTRMHTHTTTYSAAPKLMQQVFAVVLFFAFFVVFDTCFCFGYVQFLSCLLIVKVAQALFNSSRNTFVALLFVVVVVVVQLVAVVASGSAIDMDMLWPWSVRLRVCVCATFARPKDIT